MARSRKELEDIIKRGESVLLPDGRVITQVENLPSAVELAGNDLVKKQHAIGDLEAAKAEIERQLAEAKGDEDKEGGDGVTPEEEFAISLSSYTFIGKGRAKALLEAGYGSREKILEASNEDLAKVKGFEEAEKIEALRKLLNG